MKDWNIEEASSLNFNDVRLNERYTKIVEKLYLNPNESLPKSLHTHSELIAAYRFMDNPKVTFETIINSSKANTIERIKNEKVILPVQDTTSLDYTSKKISEQLGHLESKKRRGIFLHPTLLFNESGLCLGNYDAKIWTRDLAKLGKSSNRKKTGIEEKESYRWLESYYHSCEIAKQFPDKTVINVGDRESDIYELFHLTEDPNNKSDIVLRAGQNRRTLTEDNEVKLLRDRLEGMQVKGQLKVSIPKSPRRKAREATLEIKYSKIELLVPPSKKKSLSNVKINVVHIKEVSNSNDEDSIEWVLLTTLDVNNMGDAIRVLKIYKVRWKIEIFFRVLKSGCKVEELHLQDIDRLKPLLAIYMIISYRIMFLTMIGRVHPDLPADLFFSDDEWQVITLMAEGSRNENPPTIRGLIRMIGSLGGFLGRKSDGEPGPGQIWTGMKRVADFLLVYRLMKNR